MMVFHALILSHSPGAFASYWGGRDRGPVTAKSFDSQVLWVYWSLIPGSYSKGFTNPRFSKGDIPALAEADGGIDQSDHAVGLDEVPPVFTGPYIQVLGQEPVAIALSEQVLEQ